MGLVPARRPGWLLERRGNSSPRGMVAQSRFLKRDGQNPAYRPSGKISSSHAQRSDPRSITGLLRRFAARNDGVKEENGSTEEIGRLGISALALLWR